MKKSIKPTISVATVVNYMKEATGHVAHWTTIEIATSPKGMETKKRIAEQQSDEWSGVSGWRIHEKLYTMEQVKALRMELDGVMA